MFKELLEATKPREIIIRNLDEQNNHYIGIFLDTRNNEYMDAWDEHIGTEANISLRQVTTDTVSVDYKRTTEFIKNLEKDMKIKVKLVKDNF